MPWPAYCYQTTAGVLQTFPNDTIVFPIGPGGYESRWRLKETEYFERLEKGSIEWKLTSGSDDEDNDEENFSYSSPCWKPYIKFHMPSSKTIQNLWNDLEGNKKGKRDLKNVLGQVKKLTPKPIGLIRRIIEASTLPGATILDYFGGTGTTACAVMQANTASDLDRRKWILCEFGDIFLRQSGEFHACIFQTIGKLEIQLRSAFKDRLASSKSNA